MMKIRIKTTTLLISLFLLFGCNSRKVENIEAFARLYGYARWFHPSDEAQEIDWDKFAILGVQKVENIKSSEELRDSLMQLFSPIVKGLVIYNEGEEKTINWKALTPPNYKDTNIVAWQHVGLGVNENGIYSSTRSNIQTTKDFTLVCKHINNVKEFKDKEIKVTGYFKLDSTDCDDYPFFYLCPMNLRDTKKGSSFLLSKSSCTIQSKEWKKYELKTHINEDFEIINIGCIIKGKVSPLIDNFDLQVKNGTRWEHVDLYNMGFENGKIDRSKNDWYSTERAHKLKFSSTNTVEGKYALQIQYNVNQFPELPHFKETIQENLGLNLKCKLPIALYGFENSTYPQAEKQAVLQLKRQLSLLKTDPGFNRYVNLASIVIAWNAMQHFHPYCDELDVDWEATLPQTIKEAYTNKSKEDFSETLSRMIAKLKDGHGIVTMPTMFQIPVRTEWIENNIVVTASKDPKLKTGDILTKINGDDALDVLKQTESILSGSPQLSKYRALNILGFSFEKKPVEIELIRNGKKLNCEINRKKNIKTLYGNPLNSLSCALKDIEEVKPEVYYINLSRTTLDELCTTFKDIPQIKTIIFDMRWGIKAGITNILPHLIDTTVLLSHQHIPNIIYPNFKKVKLVETSISFFPKQPQLKANYIFLTSPFVVSAGETFIDIVKHYNLGVTVGEKTAGCNGDANRLLLPSGNYIAWTGKKVLKYDNSQLYLIGYKPDYPVKRTIQAAKEQRDEVLDEAIRVAEQM
ncbi:hypothetical protein EYV94_20975 [Puteibacter caeruleilacunae]|nr:hypothetical protein EYV94_20975 [Puteibacter caeruleilacunae]